VEEPGLAGVSATSCPILQLFGELVRTSRAPVLPAAEATSVYEAYVPPAVLEPVRRAIEPTEPSASLPVWENAAKSPAGTVETSTLGADSQTVFRLNPPECAATGRPVSTPLNPTTETAAAVESASPNAYELGSDEDATFTYVACARYWPECLQSSRRTSDQPAGADTDAESGRRKETDASRTSPAAVPPGLETETEPVASAPASAAARNASGAGSAPTEPARVMSVASVANMLAIESADRLVRRFLAAYVMSLRFGLPVGAAHP
jgi:hypothetical protein